MAKVLRRRSTFLLWLQALRATSAHAAPAASHNSDSTPRAPSSRARRPDDAGLAFMIQRGHYTYRHGPRQDQKGHETLVKSKLKLDQ